MKTIIGFDLMRDDELNKFVVCCVACEPGKRVPELIELLKIRGVDERRSRRSIELGVQHGTLELDVDMRINLTARSQQWP